MIELMITLTIVVILAAALGFEFSSWRGRYRVEKTVDDLYTTLMDVRARALQLDRNYFVDFSPDGRHYRVSLDDSNGAAKVTDGDAVFQGQTAWAAIQASDPVNWGPGAAATDTTDTQRSRRIDLQTVAATRAGLLSTTAGGVTGAASALGTITFSKRGIITTGLSPADSSVCIFTHYHYLDNDVYYDPDYDCINIYQTKIYLGKLNKQNDAGGVCDPTNCISK